MQKPAASVAPPDLAPDLTSDLTPDLVAVLHTAEPDAAVGDPPLDADADAVAAEAMALADAELAELPEDINADVDAEADPDAAVAVAAEADDEEDEVERRPMVARSASDHRQSHGPMNGRPIPISRASNKDETFAEGDHVVYPTHGVGRVEKIAVEDIAGHRLELIHITFEENRMTLRVPVAKARSAGLRKLATRKLFDEALALLRGRARVKRTMWSRRAQEYDAKINSGDPLAIAEVVRDLHRNAGQPDQSFSERQIYEAALDRLGAEMAALDQTDKPTAVTKLTSYLKTVA